MDPPKSDPWEPDPSKMGNWRAQLMQDRVVPPGGPGSEPRGNPSAGPGLEIDSLTPDIADYKPWILQRARTHPAMMLEFRRYESRSGLWAGWAIAYPHLITLEYTGDKLLSLDFGVRQMVIEGHGLDELARYIQQGAVLAIQEHSTALWPSPPAGPRVSAFRNVTAARQPKE